MDSTIRSPAEFPAAPRLLSSNRHVYMVDWARALTILAVVAVHAVRFGAQAAAPASEGLVQLWLQVGREVFMSVTGFVLVYAYQGKPLPYVRFVHKRFLNIGVPYLIWLTVFLAMTVPIWPLTHFGGAWLAVLPTGNGHLYYLVITFQFYLLLPLWLLLQRRVPAWLLVGSTFAMQVAGFTLAQHGQEWAAPPLLFVTYLFDFALGAAAAKEWASVRAWAVRRRRRLLVLAPLGMAGVAVVYALAIRAGTAPVAAATVFQPLTPFYTAAIMGAILAAGTWFEEQRGHWPRLSSLVLVVADASFGIYLVHMVILHAATTWAWHHAGGLGPWGVSLFAFAAALLGSIAFVRLVRHTPVAPYLIGQTRWTPPTRRPLPRPDAAPE